MAYMKSNAHEWLNCDGVGTFNGGTYGKINVDGVFTCKGDLQADSVDIDGIFTLHGALEAQNLDCDGTATVKGNVRVGTADIDGVLTVEGKFEGTTITCDGVLAVNGEVSADLVNADGCLSAREIVGERVVIRDRRNLFARVFWKWKTSDIELIEATTIELRNVRAHKVSGHDVRIGQRCEIETVDCDGTLFIDPSAKVGLVNGNPTLCVEF